MFKYFYHFSRPSFYYRLVTVSLSKLALVFFLPQVARAGRFGTKGLAITFVSDESDARTLNDVQDRFEVNISELPEEIDISSYSKCSITWFLPEEPREP